MEAVAFITKIKDMSRLPFPVTNPFTILSIVLATVLLPTSVQAADCRSVPLAEEYSRMFREDQALRGRYIEILELEHRKANFDPLEKEKLEYKITETDEANRAKLESLIRSCGWPKKLDNKKAARAAFFIIQHAPLPYQLKYLPTVKAANARGEVSNEHLAWLVDRILVRQGKLQKYGTEFVYGSNEISPVDDPKHLNQRRRRIGLPPMKQFPM